MQIKLNGKIALVTGASRGIGRAIALRLAKDGAKIAVNYAGNAKAAAEVVAEIKEKGGDAVAVQADVTDLPSIRRLFDTVIGHFGGLDILVNNAGVAASGPLAKTSEETYDRLFAVTKGVYFALQEAALRMNDGGRIISLSSGLTRNWAINVAAYAGSKAAIEQFSRSLSKELGPRNITVNVVLPGLTDTDMTAGFPTSAKDTSRQQSSFGRLGRPEDIADVIGFLASEDARWITGQFIPVNGGTTP